MQNMFLGEPTNLTVADWEKSDQWKRKEDIDNLQDECEKILAMTGNDNQFNEVRALFSSLLTSSHHLSIIIINAAMSCFTNYT